MFFSDMDPMLLIWIGIFTTFVAILLTLLGYAIHCGLIYEIQVNTGKPAVKTLTIAYKFFQGPYSSGSWLFTEACSLAPSRRTVGIYYDDPRKVAPEKLRSAIGSIIAEGSESLDPELVKAYTDHEYKVFTFPAVQNVFYTSFPFKGALSVLIGLKRVYPALIEYTARHNLEACPWLEIYGNGVIYYMGVLDKDVATGEWLSDLFVPEANTALLEDKSEEQEKVKLLSNAEQAADVHH